MRSSAVERMQSKKSDRVQAQEDLVVDAAEVLAKAIRAQNQTLSAVARRLGTSVSHVSQLLSGERNMTLRSFADIAWALDLRVALALVPLQVGWFDADVSAAARVKQQVEAVIEFDGIEVDTAEPHAMVAA